MALADYYRARDGAGPQRRRPSHRPIRPLRRPAAPAVQQQRESAGDKPGGWGSILPGLKDALFELPAGLGHLAGAAIDTARAYSDPMRRSQASLELGRATNNSPREALGAIADVATGRESDRATALNRLTGSLTTETLASGGRTVNRIGNPTQYARAWREGEIVPTLLEDLGNVALGAGGAAKLAGAGAGVAAARGLTRTSGALGTGERVLGRTAALLGESADAPISLPRRGLRASARPLQRLLDEAPQLGGLREAVPFVRSDYRAAARQAHVGAAAADRAKTETARRLMNAVKATGADLDEQAAVRAIYTGEAAGLLENEVRTGLTPDQAWSQATPQRIDESHLTRRGYDIARDFLNGTLAPEDMGRIEGYLTAVTKEADIVRREAEGGEGYRAPLNPEYTTSDQPLQVEVDRAAREGYQVDLDAPMTYPARFRSPMIQAQRMAEAAPPGAPVLRRPEDFTAAGIEMRYLPEGESPLIRPKGSRVKTRTEDGGFTLRGDQKLPSEHTREGGGPAPYSMRTLANSLGDARRLAKLDETYRQVVKGHQRNASSSLDAQTLTDIDIQARDRATRVGGTKDQIDARYKALRGEAVINAMAEKGYAPWPVAGDLNSAISPKSVDLDTTPFLPAGLKEKLVPYWNPRPPPAVMRALGATNRAFKRGVLPLSLRWQIGDAMSNFLMATVGGTDPLTLFGRMKDAKALAANPGTADLLQQAVPETSLTYGEQDVLRGGVAQVKADRRNLPILGQNRPIKNIIGRSFKVNEWTNRMQRQGFYLDRLHKQLERDAATKGMSWDDVANKLDDPVIQAKVAKAVEQTGLFLGDMANMAPWERRYLAQIMPFYPWMRHVAKLATKLAIDHPARLVFMMRIGELAAEQEGGGEELPPFLRGSLRAPGGYWQTSFMNPLADLEGGIPVTPEAFMRSLSPAIKLGTFALTGGDLGRGSLQASRPEGTSRRDWYMRETINPGILDPGALAYQASRVLPVSRAAWDLGFGRTARYGTGETITDEYGRPVDEEPRWKALPQLAGLPVPFAVEDVEQIQATRRRRKRALRNAGRGS